MRVYKKEKNERLLSPMLIAPIVLMALIAVALLVMARGRKMQMETRKVQFLETAAPESYCGEKDDAPYLLVYDGSSEESVKLRDITADILDDMRLEYRCADPEQEELNYDGCTLLLLCTASLTGFQDQFETFARWISEHNFIWLCMPEYDSNFTMLYRSLGISYCTGTFAKSVDGLEFHDDFLIGLKSRSFPDLEMNDVALEVSLENSAKLHISDTKRHIPLVWSYERNNGSTVVMFNTNLLFERNNFTGMITAALAEVEETLVWPIINSMTVFIDDVPAPQPDGYDERLKEQFGYSIKSYYMNIWWPDMKALAEKYELSYTGAMIEDYNDNTVPPFEAGTADAILQYYGAELLSGGGELALHGYNHQPLILEGTPTEDDYAGWPSTENMALALKEMVRYTKLVFPDVQFLSYVPPSNDLSQEGLSVLRNEIQGLKVISGVYYDYEGGTSFMTDFGESGDGWIYYPRITSGYDPTDEDLIRIYSMLYSKGVFSHFVHHDDVLDIDRGADLGWRKLYAIFDEILNDITNSYTPIRRLTASSGGGAAQRWNRTQYQTEKSENGLKIHLEPFEDEVWLALSCENRPSSVSGAEVSELQEGFCWLCCKEQEVEIHWSEEMP